MAGVGNIIRAVSCGNLLGENFCNVFYYIVSLWTGNVTIEDVKSQFIAAVIDELNTVLTDDVTYTNANLDNLNDPNEFWEATFSRPGGNIDNTMPAFVAAGVQLLRTDKTTRHGSKRFCGVGESMFTDGVFTPSQAFIDALEDACTAVLADDDLAGNAFALDPVIVGTDLITGLPDPDRTNYIKGAKLRRITTQNSRKGYTAVGI